MTLTPPVHLKEAYNSVNLQAGVLNEPQARKAMECSKLLQKLTEKEQKVWERFIAVVHGFLGNNKADNYKELAGALVESYCEIGCRISLKVHVLPAHLDNFKGNMGTYSKEQGEHFHQDIMKFEQRYQGYFNENMMRGYIRAHT